MKTYIVGGAVRDELLGKVPKDIDYVVVGATPEEMIAQGFEQVGADFPVFLHPETKDEYALARTERKTGVGYHGFDVNADPSVTLKEDLSRRDLTINAMAKDMETGEIIDPYSGQHDLECRTLRHVSTAFAEDPLRVIRLARFAARYSFFTIATSTMVLATEMVEGGELNSLPDERFWAEMEKVLSEDDPGRFFRVLDDVQAFRHVPFFADLFGTDAEFPDNKTLMAFTHIGLMMESIPAEHRLMMLTAVMTQPERKRIWSAPVRTQKLYINLDAVRAMTEVTPDTIFALLQRVKFWSQGTEFDDLIAAMKIDRIIFEDHVISAQDLKQIAEATRVVSAAQFPHLEGKALGQAIAVERRSAIQLALDE